MKVKLAKWGNSLAFRLPKRLADELSLAPGNEVEVDKKGSRLLIETAPRRKIPHYRLEELLAQIKPGQKPPPYEDWAILQSEWPAEDWSDVAPTDAEGDLEAGSGIEAKSWSQTCRIIPTTHLRRATLYGSTLALRSVTSRPVAGLRWWSRPGPTTSGHR